MDSEMTVKEAIEQAVNLADLGSLPEGPKGQLEAIELAQAYALIAIAKSLASVISETPNGPRLHIQTDDSYR